LFSVESIASAFLLPPNPLRGRQKRISANINILGLDGSADYLQVSESETMSMNRTTKVMKDAMFVSAFVVYILILAHLSHLRTISPKLNLLVIVIQ